LVLLTRCDGRV